MIAISCREVGFCYGSQTVLKNVSLEIEQGTFLGIVGPNGAGKSTLIKLLTAQLPVQTGKIELFGSDIASFKEWRKIGYLAQKLKTINPHFPATVREVISQGLLSQKKMPRWLNKGDQQKIDHIIAELELNDFQHKLIGELSGGQQQRTLLAKALVGSPEIIILDEPTNALDQNSKDKLIDILKRFNREKGLTIILITHDAGSLGLYANRILYLDETILFHGGFTDLCHSPAMTAYLGEFNQHLICHQHDKNKGVCCG